MIRNLIGFGTGLLFGLGLAVSHMVNPGKVLGFLDFTGDWDPSLLIVMGVAVGLTFVSYIIAKGRSAPVFAELFQFPEKKAIMDSRLMGGSALFGAGWGLVGYCPGPGISSLVYLAPQTFMFVVAVVAGSAVAGFLPKVRVSGAAIGGPG